MPDLILVDVLMPQMDGFEFRNAYFERYGHRVTAFVFLSGLTDARDIVAGLEAGADDYITKGQPGDVFVAKLRSLLARVHRHRQPSFSGDLSEFSFARLMRFCEQKALTGRVEITYGNSRAILKFDGGQVNIGDSDSGSEPFENLYALMNGRFVILPHPIDYAELAHGPAVDGGHERGSQRDSCSVRIAEQPQPPHSLPPLGRLSGVQAGRRLFQVQTEFVGTGNPRIEASVLLDGRVVFSRKASVDEAVSRQGLNDAVEGMHADMEKEVRMRLARCSQGSGAPESAGALFERLISEGVEAYLRHEYAEALAFLEQAHEINPHNRRLNHNLRALKKKLETASLDKQSA